MRSLTCSKCHGPRDRDGQRYCRACFNAYHKDWRDRRVAKRLHAVVEDLQQQGGPFLCSQKDTL